MKHPVTSPVAYLQGDGNYTRIHYRDHSTYLVATTLRQVLAHRYPHLLCVHKSYAVDRGLVSKLRRTGQSGLIELTYGGKAVVLPVARRRVNAVWQAVEEVMRERVIER